MKSKEISLLVASFAIGLLASQVNADEELSTTPTTPTGPTGCITEPSLPYKSSTLPPANSSVGSTDEKVKESKDASQNPTPSSSEVSGNSDSKGSAPKKPESNDSSLSGPGTEPQKTSDGNGSKQNQCKSNATTKKPENRQGKTNENDNNETNAIIKFIKQLQQQNSLIMKKLHIDQNCNENKDEKALRRGKRAKKMKKMKVKGTKKKVKKKEQVMLKMRKNATKRSDSTQEIQN